MFGFFGGGEGVFWVCSFVCFLFFFNWIGCLCLVLIVCLLTGKDLQSLCNCVAADANIERTQKQASIGHATSLFRNASAQPGQECEQEKKNSHF